MLNSIKFKSYFKMLMVISSFFIFILFYSFSLYSFELIQQIDVVTIHKEGEELKEIAVKKGSLKFNLNKNKYDVFSHTSISFSKDTLKMETGEIRILVENFEGLKIMTPVGIISITNNGDYIIQYNNEKASATVIVLDGSALVQGYYREEILNLQSGERGGFNGIMEADGPAFDVLLKGRKSIRGHLSGPDKLTETQKNDFLKQYYIPLKPKVVKTIKVKAKPGEICSEPFAKYNDCVWRCVGENQKTLRHCDIKNEKVNCIRERCLANGQWGDRAIQQGEAKANCKANSTPLIKPCSY